ncbi:MAG: hypothetical protein IJQ73_10915 [Kiritimatiellae bacterium]|nr:hypothetical protein [Kiritimatiellia bacterium]
MTSRLHFAVVPLLLCAGCVVYHLGLDNGSRAPLSEPAHIPDAPDMSVDFAAYRVFAVASDASPFSETLIATDMGRMGVPVDVGTAPLRRIAARGIQSLVERHFRRPLADERPALALETSPQFLSVRQDGTLARVKISVAVKCVRQDGARKSLISKIYTAERTGPWVGGQVPVALYEAMNDIWAAFLRDFRQAVPPATLMGGHGEAAGMPELRALSFGTRRDGSAVTSGKCEVACNGWEAFQAAAWAKQQIFSQCVEHLGIDKGRVRMRYDNDETRYDADSKVWRFAFATWARTRMALQYDPASRRGCAIVDLELFGGTAEEAAKAAKAYIVREMNLRAATYADDTPGARADIDFLDIETEPEGNLVIVKFRLVY